MTAEPQVVLLDAYFVIVARDKLSGEIDYAAIPKALLADGVSIFTILKETSDKIASFRVDDAASAHEAVAAVLEFAVAPGAKRPRVFQIFPEINVPLALDRFKNRTYAPQ